MSSFKQKKRRVLEVRKRTKKRMKKGDESLGLKRREGMYRSEGASVRGSISTDRIGRSVCVSGNHHIVFCNSEDKKVDMIVNEINQLQHRFSCLNSKSNSRRRKAGTIVFTKTKAVARALEARLGNPITKKSTKQAKYARYSFKPKGQGRVGGRSGGPEAGITIASVYRNKQVGILHARSSEKEETSICSDLRSGKLRYVIVAESGKIGCGDPLWDMRDYVGLVVLCDVQHQDAGKIVDMYEAMASYGGLGLCGCKNNLQKFAHRPHILSLVSNLNCRTMKNLTSHLRELNSSENHELFLPTCVDGGISNLRSKIFEFYMSRNESKIEDTKVVDAIVMKCMDDEKKDVVDMKKVESLFVALSRKYPKQKSS